MQAGGIHRCATAIKGVGSAGNFAEAPGYSVVTFAANQRHEVSCAKFTAQSCPPSPVHCGGYEGHQHGSEGSVLRLDQRPYWVWQHRPSEDQGPRI